ncbi:type II toxin-antitoxin system antitoxin SocA domain-containing protein [Mitsuaria sp. GD03876]|uniref:Panacea domain-containing protein n=1 Tax=Mitsuaria sp. GD03876 TaxID=2975399 RepID=UPI002447177E|nr:type II toxin-antitoxin system antitoxin SocA domain-containing protein [Mitsuaria sp. GD03876]MDH0863900.1 DUF4065 domain-containing protein [Mitsuaria sp. GD03876]
MAISPQLDAVHRLIIECHREYFEESPSPAKVQKLCYYAQGYSLAKNRELFPDDFEAWQKGPVVADLYARYKDHAWRPIETRWETPLEEAAGFDLVREVVGAYGQYDAAALSNMTHLESPWIDARAGIPDNEGCQALIPKTSLQAFFRTSTGTHHEFPLQTLDRIMTKLSKEGGASDPCAEARRIAQTAFEVSMGKNQSTEEVMQLKSGAHGELLRMKQRIDALIAENNQLARDFDELMEQWVAR